MEIKAYAKVNLILNILGKRSDGFHEIETLFHAIDLFDVVSVEEGSEKQLPFGEKDLAFKALDLMRKHYKLPDYSIKIEKNIPVAAGLGGGSADSAAVIYGLAKLNKISENKELYKLAEELGSDVPFCLAVLYGHTAAIGRGRGEILEYIEPCRGWVTLYKSDFELNNKTAAVYNSLKEEDYLLKYSIDAFLNADSIEEKNKLKGNMLQPALERLSGEKSVHTLCGAGPTYFELGTSGDYKLL